MNRRFNVVFALADEQIEVLRVNELALNEPLVATNNSDRVMSLDIGQSFIVCQKIELKVRI